MSAAGSTPGRKGSIRLCRSIEMRHVRYAWSNRIARAHRILLTSVLPATLAFSTTAAELECRGKDISGATSCWSKSSSAALHSFPINLVDLPDVIVGGIRHRLRNNAVSHYRVTLNPGDLTWSWLSLEVAGTAFGPATTRYFEDRETQQPFFQEIAGREKLRGIIRIRDHSRTGWLGVYKRASSTRWCFAAVLAFEPSAWGAGRADELYEMILRMKDCTGRRTRVQMEDWLHSVRAVPEGYNGK